MHSTLTLVRVADLTCQMEPIISVDSLDFLYLKQNLLRVITVDLSGLGMVKGNSTCNQILHRRPREFPMTDFLILSALSMLPMRPKVKEMTEALFQARLGASGTRTLLPLVWIL
jgi:hypothetical protein